MSVAARAELESQVRAACSQGNFSAAATLALEGLGDELYGFLLATCRTETDAADVFSALSEQLWRGLPKFRWQSSLRTWAYALARHAALDHAKLDGRRRYAFTGRGAATELTDG